MSLKQLKEEIAHLPSGEQRELVAYIVSIQANQDRTFKQRMAQKIDDNNPENWVELDDLKKRYSD